MEAKVTDAQIANMFMLGFEGKTLTAESPVVKAVCGEGLGGVILFKKNIGTQAQLRMLTRTLGRCAHKPLIATDQEGGTVRRIRYGHEYPRASQVAMMGTRAAYRLYGQMGAELRSLGITYDLAPVADLDIEPRNYIIHKLGRSFGKDPDIVRSFDKTFIKAMHRYHILTALKHFPGHGSSLGDTHRGFVDVTKTWNRQELEPFWDHAADSVMIAHVVNRNIDPSGLPMSLSPRGIKLLRKHNGNVVAITDDLQMGAIRKYYSLRQTIRMAINAGDDILLFGNQLAGTGRVDTKQLTGIVRELLAQKKIRASSIIASNRRINRMRRKAGFGEAHGSTRRPVRHKRKISRIISRDDGRVF
jgi:beta-N-acetylhexosaminidase